MRYRSILIIVFLGISTIVFSQNKNNQKEVRSLVREGNEQYNHLKFSEAEIAYKKAIEKDPNYTKAIYNLGNTLYQENRFQEAVSEYQKVAKTTKDKMLKSAVFHNLGNTMMKTSQTRVEESREGNKYNYDVVEKNYELAVEAYKEALRNNPKDEETRYNLALAQKMLKNQQNKNKNKKDQKKKDDKKKDKNKKDQKDDKKKEDKKDKKNEQDKKKDQQNDQKNKDKKDKKQPKKQPNKLSKQQMQQLLEAMNNEDNKTQKKMNKKQAKGRKVKREKDW